MNNEFFIAQTCFLSRSFSLYVTKVATFYTSPLSRIQHNNSSCKVSGSTDLLGAASLVNINCSWNLWFLHRHFPPFLCQQPFCSNPLQLNFISLAHTANPPELQGKHSLIRHGLIERWRVIGTAATANWRARSQCDRKADERDRGRCWDFRSSELCSAGSFQQFWEFRE